MARRTEGERQRRQNLADASSGNWNPAMGSYAVDTADSRIGEVRRLFEGSVYLVPPGGGAEWAVPPDRLRQPTDAEVWQARVWTSPARLT
ncbi:hypothetical protein [Streptomyces sp. BPTC-684]|uniref:hypothetical protein n=1 Tax=Streptomyces sp. BPTC-684 TaxID=3043734 RepID=UPI0024B148CC|nr:hypothetical protein [Streptomyces sp. BPTC-684]WHM40252.1 hypothetical protein QIY60_27615 [Streptomyces sp. BPTC-684]